MEKSQIYNYIHKLNTGYVYPNTNERLDLILPNIDFKNKDVLTVLGSADQYYSAYYLGAKNVDTFDYNICSYLFYFLKTWYIEKYEDPEFKIGSLDEINDILYNLNITNEDEYIAYNVWKQFSSTYSYNPEHLFIKANDILWGVPYKDNIKNIISISKLHKPNFKEIDIINDFDIDKTYDIIIFSNILDSVPFNSIDNQILARNLNSILNKDGILVTSCVSDFYEKNSIARKDFLNYFTFQLGPSGEYKKNINKNLSHVYKKK